MMGTYGLNYVLGDFLVNNQKIRKRENVIGDRIREQ